jgi:hypothetical protein
LLQAEIASKNEFYKKPHLLVDKIIEDTIANTVKFVLLNVKCPYDADINGPWL